MKGQEGVYEEKQVYYKAEETNSMDRMQKQPGSKQLDEWPICAFEGG